MKITTLEQLEAASLARRSVMINHPAFVRRPQPAAWVISMQARTVLGFMRSGMTLYEKKRTAVAKKARS